MDAEALVVDYLGRLNAAAESLPPSRRAELAGEVRQHIEMALAEAGVRDEVTVRNVLDRLGRPDEIVDAERGSEGPPPGNMPESSTLAPPSPCSPQPPIPAGCGSRFFLDLIVEEGSL